MDIKHENLSNNESNEELDPKIQALADMAGKMGELGRKPDEYNEFGFDGNGVHKNGTRFDEEGYDKGGRDRRGYDRLGFDKEGYNIFGYNKERRDRDGYDGLGFDKEGYNKSGFDSNGVHKNGTRFNEEGYDKFGRDRDGFFRDGFSIDGFNREGINKYTGTEFYPDGWNQSYTMHRDTGTEYDPEGYNISGYDKGGRDRRGYDKFGIDKEGYDKHGIDSYGYDRNGNRRNPDGSPMFYTSRKNGYDVWGVDKDGYKEDGFDRFGFDREGYDREGLDKDGYTREYNAKFNEFGVDENGYMKNGEIDPDVEFAISFSESGIKELTKYAAEKGMEYKEVQGKIESARKKFPAIDETITNILLTGNKMRAAAISNDCEKFINGELDVKEFWDKHPRLNISGVLFNFINDPEKRKQFSDRTVENLVLDSDSIEENLRIFGTSRYDVPGALKGIEDFKKTYVRFGVDGSPEQIQKKRENTKKIFDTMKYLSKYKNQNLNTLLGSRQSFDGGQTWTDFNGELIGHAMDALKADKKLICVQSVKDYIVKQIKNSSQNKIQ